MGVSNYTALLFSCRRIARAQKVSASQISKMDSAFLSSLTEQADQRTPEQHFTWFCLSPKPSGKSVLSEILGWKMTATIYHKVIKPVLGRGAAATLSTPSVASNQRTEDAPKLSRRQKAKLSGKTKTVGSSSKNESMSDGVSERSSCSDPGKQSPARADEDTTPPATPGPSAIAARNRFIQDLESLSDRPTPKRSASKRTQLDTTSQSSSAPPRKYLSYEVSSTGSTKLITPNSSNPATGVDYPNVTDEDLIDIVRCTRRMHDPMMRGKYISDVLSQCTRSSRAAKSGASLEEQYMQNIRLTPNVQNRESVSKDRPPVRDSSERSQMRSRPAERPAAQQMRRPMYRYLMRGGPPGEFCNQ